jgi:hypothetical protein
VSEYANTADVVALLVFITWWKWFKYFAWVDELRVLSKTLAGAGSKIASFLVLFLALHLGFCISMYIMFSGELKDYRNVATTVYTMFRGLVGDFDFDFSHLSQSPNIWTGKVTATVFTIIMVFILLTMLIAIVSESFERAAALGSASKSRENLLFWLNKVGIPDHPTEEAKMRIVIFKAENLAVGDRRAGTSDPYVKLFLTSGLARNIERTTRSRQRGRRVHKSAVQEATLSPRWNESVKMVREKTDNTLVVSVYDEDLSSVDEFLGQATIPLRDIPMDGHAVEVVVHLHARTYCCLSGIQLSAAQREAQKSQVKNGRHSFVSSFAGGGAGEVCGAEVRSLGDHVVEPSGLVRLGISCLGNLGQDGGGGRHSGGGGSSGSTRSAKSPGNTVYTGNDKTLLVSIKKMTTKESWSTKKSATG